MNTENISRDDWIIGGLALLLAIALLFFPWISISIGPFTVTSAGTGAPDAIFGLLALLLALVLLADLAIERFSSQTQLPMLGGSRVFTRMVLAIAALVCVALKFVLHTSNVGWGFFITAIVAIVLVVATVRARQARPVMPSRPAGPAGPAGPPPAI